MLAYPNSPISILESEIYCFRNSASIGELGGGSRSYISMICRCLFFSHLVSGRVMMAGVGGKTVVENVPGAFGFFCLISTRVGLELLRWDARLLL